ncbi:50S ribosomal protein L6 [Pyruvatibacter sp.]|uniref:50S ribosomal protein L6 n=1 Tax=Pyruvatibacter sp. TaxID=1981328 RepID=UPI0032EF123B
MSRIGKMPIAIASGITVTLEGQTVKAKGSKGELSLTLVPEVTISQGEDGLTVAPVDDSQRARAMWGLSRSLVANMVQGVAEGFSKTLEINGVGYRAEMQGKDLKLALGFSHDVIHAVPDGIQVQTPKPTEIVVTGIDKQKVGQVAAEIRSYRPPEPYKGKGVKYADEYIFRKEGKKK